MSAQTRMGLVRFGLILGIVGAVIGIGLIITGDMTGITLVGLGLSGALLNGQQVRRSARRLRSSAQAANNRR